MPANAGTSLPDTVSTDNIGDINAEENAGSETNTSGTAIPDTALETKPPETKAPETAAPETMSPETTVAPETRIPVTKAPEVKPAATKAPEIKPPESAPLDEAAVFASPDIAGLPMPSAPGTYVKTAGTSVIDYSNCSEGYVMLKFDGAADKAYVVRVISPGGVYYDYMLGAAGGYRAFPLSEGSGSYTVTLYEPRGGNKYAAMLSAQFSVALKNEFTAFLYPNYYVNYSGASKAAKLAAHLTRGMDGALDKISAIYYYVINNISYDKELAAKLTAASASHVPDLEKLIANKKGICFDYASLMSAMLRSLGIPSKLIFGYTGDVYHAWINIHTAETGWINAMISFDGDKWKLMDPTYASTSKENPSIMKYIGDGTNYAAKYVY